MTKDFDPLDTRASDAAKAEEHLAQRVKQEQEASDLKYLMSLPQFRRFMWRQLEETGMFRTSFSMNGLEMAFREGQRNLGIKLTSELTTHCPNDYSKMQREAKSERARSNAAR